MNELTNIKDILNSKLHKETIFSPDDLDRLTEIFSKLVKANNNIKELRLFDDATLHYLLDKELIDETQFNHLKAYRYLTCEYGDKLESSSLKILKDIISQVIFNVKNINQEVENKEIKALIKAVDNRFNNITEEQLDLLFSTISDSNYSLEEKRDMFLYISVNTIKYGDELIEEVEEEQEQEQQDKGMTEAQCKELFNKYGYDFDLLNNSNKLRFIINGIYEKVDNNFKVFKDNNINLYNNCNYNIFLKKQAQICDILVRGDVNCIQGVIDTCRDNELVQDGEIKLYLTVSEPSNFVRKKREYKIRRHSNGGEGSGTGERGSYQDFVANVEYFTEKCNKLFNGKINFLNRLYEFKDGAALLSYPHQRILEIERILKAYGFSEQDFFEAATSVFATMHHADILDIAVELDVLDYIKKNRSRLSISVNDEVVKLLYVASLNKEVAFSPENRANFAGETVPKYYLNATVLKQLLDKTEIPQGIESLPYDKNLHKILEDRVADSDFDIETALEKANSEEISIIKVLEEKFKKDDLVYEIAGTRVSRNKVLRIFSAISDLDIDFKSKEYPILKYALTRNSYFTKDQIISLMKAYHNAKEEMKGKNI